MNSQNESNDLHNGLNYWGFDNTSYLGNFFYNIHGKKPDGYQAIFPIVQKDRVSRIKPIGTGFFISTMGMFATARHVLTGDDQSTSNRELIGVLFNVSTNSIEFREIEHIAIHPVADVGIGFLRDNRFVQEGIRVKNPCFELTGKFPKPGEKVAAFGFPRPKSLVKNELIEFAFTYAPIPGIIEEYCEDGAPLLKRPCFRTTMNTAPGSSGGPVAYGDGKVFAIISTGFENINLSYVSPIAEILDLPIPGVRMPTGLIRYDLKVRDLIQLKLVIFDS
jgi:hypothetical protein